MIYTNSGGAPSYTVGGDTRTTNGINDFNPMALTEGQHYVRFLAQASGAGSLQFMPNANPGRALSHSLWSGFQLQSAAVPEPDSPVLVLAALGALWVVRRRQTARL